MRYLYQNVKTRKGETIHVELSGSTKVMVLSEKQFDKYRNNRTFTYFGGQKNGSYDFKSPRDGSWVVVVEKGDWKHPQNIQAKVSVVPKEARATTPPPAIEASPEPEAADEDLTTTEEVEETED
jgi:hypothetical protein